MPFNSGTVGISLSADVTSVLDLITARAPVDYVKQVQYAGGGAGLGQADRIFHDKRTLAPSTTEDLDLNAGTITDAFGVVFSVLRIKTIVIAASSANVNDVIVGGAASNGFINWVADATDKIVVKPGGFFALSAPTATAYAVTAATGDLLRVGNGGAGTSVDYDVILIGAST